MNLDILCINLPSAITRKERMIERFNSHQLKYTFVDAVDSTSYQVNEYLTQIIDNQEYIEEHCKNSIKLLAKDIACFLAHIKALRIASSSDKEYVLICEDDILLHNDFVNSVNILLQNFPVTHNILMLYAMICSDVQHYNKMFININDNLWGAQAYIVRVSSICNLLAKYNTNFKSLITMYPDEHITSEIILRKSNTLLSSYALVIEDCIDSNINSQDLPWHVKHSCFWNYHLFSNCDNKRQSILCNYTPAMSWLLYKKLENDDGKVDIISNDIPLL